MITRVPWTPWKPTNYLWKVTGDGMFFHDFFVPAENYNTARARAEDILAGSDGTQHLGKRFYGTVDSHIVKVERHGKFLVEGNFHNETIVSTVVNEGEMT